MSVVKVKTKNVGVKRIVTELEAKGKFVLANKIEEALGSKETRRSAKINAIKLAATIRDRMEDAFEILRKSKLLRDLSPDIISTLESDLDKLEDRISRVVQDYLEIKLDQDKGEDEKVV